jgi:APA family basic amino acid/polyamine antiporter
MLPGKAVPRVSAPEDGGGLVRGLGLLDSTMIVVGSMIGSGIFIVSADIGRQVKSPALLLLVWLITALLTMAGALSYGELAAAMPRAGGQYVYLRESLGPLWGFLYGWSTLLIIQTATIAAVAIAFAKFTGVLVPWFNPEAWILDLGILRPFRLLGVELGPYHLGLNRQNLLAILSIGLLTAVNLRGVRTGALVQNVFTLTKTAALGALIVLGFVFSSAAVREVNFGFLRGAGPALPAEQTYQVGDQAVQIGLLSVIAVAMVGSLFSSVAWENVTFTGGEVKDPARNLPRAMLLGTCLVGLLYLLANLAYLNVLPFHGAEAAPGALERGIDHATQDRVGTASAEVIFGPRGAAIMAVAIMISTFGCNNGLILTGARIFYAMAADGLFFRRAGALNRFRVPGNGLLIQGVWASVLCLSGTYGQLLDFITFTQVLFYVLTIAGLFALRIRRPDLPRPYRALGYPFLPAAYIAVALFIEVALLRYKPQFTWPGLLIVILGVPVYWIWRNFSDRTTLQETKGE